MNTRNVASGLIVAAGLLLFGPAASATILGFEFRLLPAGGSISGTPGETIGWGYEITNTSGDWLAIAALDSDPFEHADASGAIFDFPIVAPGGSVSVAYNAVSGLFELTWDADAPIGFSNSGLFVLTGEFFDGDPLSGGVKTGEAQASREYRAAVRDGGGGTVPEPASLLLFALGLLGAGRSVVRFRR